MNEKQQQLTFDKGITNIPSDAICSDNCLSESTGMVYMNGEHRPIQNPVEAFEYPDTAEMEDATLMYVHRVNQSAMYIVRLSSTSLIWGNVVDGTFQQRGVFYDTTEDGVIVKSVGKTLVVTQYDAGIGYFTWNATKNTYSLLGGDLPEIKLKFQLTDWVDGRTAVGGRWTEGVFDVWSSDSGESTINSHKEETEVPFVDYVHHEVLKQNLFNDAVVGVFWNHVKEVRKARRFCFPFWVRYAIKLYDGSYTSISEPILMYPTVKNNFGVYLTYNSDWNTTEYPSSGYISTEFGVTYNPHCAKLKFKVDANAQELEDWKDIIEGVDVFVSEEVLPMNVNANWYMIDPKDPSRGNYVMADHAGNDYFSVGYPNDGRGKWTTFVHCESYSEQQFIDKLIAASRFYQVMELRTGDLKDTTSLRDSTEIMTDTTLTNLTTNTQLGVDDYYSHTKVGAKTAMVYNGRLILGHLQRSFYKGGESFISYKREHNEIYDVYVTIDTPDGEKMAHNQFWTNDCLQYYFYYPDPRATKVDIFIGETNIRIVSHPLQKHPYLNGAYFFAGLPDDVWEDVIHMVQPTGYDSSPEKLLNEIYVSEVNNPLVYRPAGDLVAGLGTIVGLATQTTALSQGQFGQFPLIIFASDGIYAASVSTDGSFSAIHPLSREVCNNAKSIAPTDTEVFFSSNKGLMMVYGNVVKHVSEQLDGEFVKMLSDRDTFIAYDYRDSLLWIANRLSTHCYVFNKKTGTIHKSVFFTKSRLPEYSGNTYKFDGFVDVDALDVKQGPANDAFKANAIILSLRGEDAVITSLQTPDEALPIFYSRTSEYHGFLGCSEWTATPDMKQYISGTQYYTNFDQYASINSHNIFLANNGNYYQKTGENLSLILTSAQFSSLYDSSAHSDQAILNKAYTNEADAVTDLQNSTTDVPLSMNEPQIVYDTANKRFYYKVTFIVMTGTTQHDYSLLYTGFPDDADYVDTNNSGHPLADVLYISIFTAYEWISSDLSSLGIIGRIRAVVQANIDDDVTEGTYARATLQEIINGKLMTSDYVNLQTVPVSRDSSKVVFNNTTQQFVNEVVYSYFWRGNVCKNWNYYLTFEGSLDIYNIPSANNLYVADDLYFAWNDNNQLELAKFGISNVVNDYPDTLMQVYDGSVYSLLQRPQPEDDTTKYDAVLKTRPMKLENALALKSIMQIRHIYAFHALPAGSPAGSAPALALSIFASNNLDNWVELHSLRGTPWKYYKFQYDFSNLIATDRFAGTMLITQERRTNKLR